MRPPAEHLIEPTMTAVAVYQGDVATVIDRVTQMARAEAGNHTVDTDKGRKAIASVAYKVARSKTLLEGYAKELTDPLTQQVKAINASRDKIKAALDSLRDEIRHPLTRWENEETRRIEAIKIRLGRIQSLGAIGGFPSSADLKGRLVKLEELEAFNWQEFADTAMDAAATASRQIQDAIVAAEQREAEQAELAALRAAAQAAAPAPAVQQPESQSPAAPETAASAAAPTASEDPKASVNRAVRDALIGLGASHLLAVKIVQHIARGDVPHTSINYSL